MSAHAIPPVTTPSRTGVLPLEPGDHLTREEFERRYDATPGLKKAELIEGVVYMAPAVRWDYHSRPHANLMTWLGVYCASTPGVFHGDNSSIRLDLDNEPQPDAAMIIDPAWGGQSKISADNYLEGAAKELIFNNDFIFPISSEVKLNGVFFFDYGKGFNDNETVSLNLRKTAGFEVRWISPFGPLRAAYGLNLEPRPGEKKGVFEFTVGSIF